MSRPGKLWRWRVLRPDGSELTADLPHAGDGKCATYGIQRGVFPPSAQIGRSQIPLLPYNHLRAKASRGDAEAIAVKALYDELDEAMRVERYDRDAPDDSDPRWTGTIERINRTATGWTAEAQDSWARLQAAQTERQEYFVNTASNIVRYMLNDWHLLHGDDMKGIGGQPTYFVTNGSYDIVSAKDHPWIRVQPAANARVLIETGTQLTQQQLAPGKIDAIFSLHAEQGDHVRAGLFFGFHDGNGACYETEFGMDTSPGAGKPVVLHVRLLHYPPAGDQNGGIPSILFDLPLQGAVLPPSGMADADVQLAVLVKDQGIQVRVNGQAVPGSTWLAPMGSPPQVAGTIGLMAWNHLGHGRVLARDWYAFERQPLFDVGSTFVETTAVLEHNFNAASNLDCIAICASAANLDLRKVCKPGRDQILMGTDLTSPVTPGAPIAGITNGTAETGDLTGWTHDDATAANGGARASTEQVHSGTYAISLGNTSLAPANGGGWAFQDFAVPGEGAVLSLWYWTSADQPAAQHGDQAILLVDPALAGAPGPRPSDGSVLATMLDADFLTNTPAANGQTWTRAILDVAPWAGRTVRLHLVADEFSGSAGGDATALFVDDVQLLQRLPIFSEGQGGNVAEPTRQPSTTKFRTALTVVGKGQGSDPPTVVARDLAAIRRYGLLSGQENVEDVKDYSSLLEIAAAMAELSSAPGQAKQFKVLDVATAGMWRELDLVGVHLPTLGAALASCMVVVVGFEETEGSPEKLIYGDDYPLSLGQREVAKLRTQIDNLMGAALQYVPPAPAGTAGVQQPNDAVAHLPIGGVFTPPDYRLFIPDASGGLSALGSGSGLHLVTELMGDVAGPSSFAAAARVAVGDCPFTVDNPDGCAIMVIANVSGMLTAGAAVAKGVAATWQLVVGHDLGSSVKSSQSLRWYSKGGETVFADDFAATLSPDGILAPGDYHAYLILTPGFAGQLDEAHFDIEVYCT